jgi:aromatic ring hydroxylase
VGLRTGAEYLAALRDGREVWLNGERVTDVGAHPQLAGAAHSLAENFDIQHNPAYGDLLTSVSPRTGEPISRSWHLPRSVEDLTRGREMFEFWERRAGGVLGRHPPYIASLFLGLYHFRTQIAKANPEWCENIEHHFDYLREQDLAIAFSAIDPHRDRKLPTSTLEYLSVVQERPEGMVVRGAQVAATGSPYADEYLAIVGTHGGDQRDIMCFCVPIASPGLKLVCRPSLSHAGEPGHPLSSRWDEMDVWAIFDDVLVPRDRMFIMNNQERISGAILPVPWGFFYGMIRILVKSEALLGICFAAADYLGTRDQPHVQALLAEAVAGVESLHALARRAEENPIYSAEGLAIPNPRAVAAGRVIDLQTHARLIEITRQICGAELIVAPSERDLSHPEIGPVLMRFGAGTDERAADRFKLMKLAWEYVGDGFGQRQLLFEELASVPMAGRRNALLNHYDATPAMRLAKDLAGIEQPPLSE